MENIKAKNKIEEILDGNLRGDWTFSCNHIEEKDGLCNKRCNGFCKEYEKLVQQLSEDKVEFAKLHVNAALKEALESIPCLGSSSDIPTYEEVEEAVLNCYPENLIQ